MNLVWFGIVVFVAYIIFMLYMLFHLRKISLSDFPSQNNLQNQISVIVAVRNEEKNISVFIQHLLNQTYPYFELIVVNDNSNDNTARMVQSFNDARIRWYQPNKPVKGKKESLKAALEIVTSEWIVFSDADVVLSKDWLWSYAQKIKKCKYDFIMAPVMMTSTTQNFLSLFQQMDFASMQYVSLASAHAGIPFMCNGANMAIKKRTALTLYQKIDTTIASGDDVFLLHAFLQEKKGEVELNLNQGAVVETSVASTWKEFINQRLRWASKAKYYKNHTAIFVSLLIYISNLFLMVAFIFSCIYFPYVFWLFLIFWLIKMIMDFLLFHTGKRVFLLPAAWKLYFPLVSFIYFWYVSIIGFFSIFTPIKWKKRRWK